MDRACAVPTSSFRQHGFKIQKDHSNSQVLALINESDDSDPVYSSEDEFKPTKSDMETESSSENGK